MRTLPLVLLMALSVIGTSFWRVSRAGWHVRGLQIGCDAENWPRPFRSDRRRRHASRCHERPNPLACTPVDEFLAELEARMASATRADGVQPPLTAEALQVIAAADQGGTPMFTSANLARIAKENGVDVSSDMTPNDIIAELRRRQRT